MGWNTSFPILNIVLPNINYSVVLQSGLDFAAGTLN